MRSHLGGEWAYYDLFHVYVVRLFNRELDRAPSLTFLEIARSDQNREPVRHQLLPDLKADTLIGAVTSATGLFGMGVLL